MPATRWSSNGRTCSLRSHRSCAEPAPVAWRQLPWNRRLGHQGRSVARAARRPQASSRQPDAVTLAYLHPDHVDHNFHESLTATLLFDAGHHGRLLRGKYLAQFCGSTGVTMARNVTVKTWLDSGNYDAEWLWWVDTDMGWQPDSLERLMAIADPVERPIVGGLCFGLRHQLDDGMHGRYYTSFPTVYDIGETEDRVGFQPRYAYPVNQLQQVAATGSAFLVVHRSVFQRIRDRYGDHWYDNIPHPKAEWPLGEDVSFCLRASTLDIPIHIHTGIKTNHHKEFYVDEQVYFQQLVAPPATVPTAVLVPVVGRPQNAAPFMRSLKASTGMATVYAICEADDLLSRAAWQEAGATLIVQQAGRPGTFACKINDGVKATSEPFVFLVGDDVEFRAGWLDHAQFVAGAQNAAVVGTVDQCNPKVMAGDHATHMLIARQYIDEVGASWDGPGVCCHEGYGHQYVDNELVEAARWRSTFAMAFGSVVQHNHPITGRTQWDAVYERGHATAKADSALFSKRRSIMARQARTP